MQDADLQVVFVPEVDMVQGIESVLGAVVALGNISITSSPPGAGSSSTTIVAYADGRCQLKARLRGPGFDFDPAHDVEQSFMDVVQLTWSWTVTPQSAGSRPLELVLTPVVVNDGVPWPGGEKSFVATILVNAASDPQSTWNKANEFFAQPLPAAVLAMVVAGLSLKGLAAWIGRRRGRRPPDHYESVP